MYQCLKRIIKTVLLTIVMAAVIAKVYMEVTGLPLKQVLTVNFIVLSMLQLVPSYFIEWANESKYESYTEGQIVLLIIIVGWIIVFSIIWAICRSIFNFDLLFWF